MPGERNKPHNTLPYNRLKRTTIYSCNNKHKVTALIISLLLQKSINLHCERRSVVNNVLDKISIVIVLTLFTTLTILFLGRFTPEAFPNAIMAGGSTFIGSLSLSFLLRGLRKRKGGSFPSGKSDRTKLIAFINKNYSNPLFTIKLIHEELGLSYNAVNSIIRKEFKIGYKQYLNDIRMEKAKKLLATTNIPIASIGEQVGYRYSNSFSRTFRTLIGITPNEYRKITRS